MSGSHIDRDMWVRNPEESLFDLHCLRLYGVMCLLPTCKIIAGVNRKRACLGRSLLFFEVIKMIIWDKLSQPAGNL